MLIPTFARHDSNATGTVRLPPCAASCRARSMFCRSPILPHPRREPLSPPPPSLDPRQSSRRRAFGEYGSALTILPSEPPRVSTGMIYAAAFHIFHCFQVFGSICKIKFVMREHSALPPPAIPRHPCTLLSPPFATRTRVDAYGRPVNFLSCWNTGCSEKILVCYETRYSSQRMLKPFLIRFPNDAQLKRKN